MTGHIPDIQSENINSNVMTTLTISKFNRHFGGVSELKHVPFRNESLGLIHQIRQSCTVDFHGTNIFFQNT